MFVSTHYKNRSIRHAVQSETAERILQDFEEDFNILCFTKGQFSIINVLSAFLKKIDWGSFCDSR